MSDRMKAMNSDQRFLIEELLDGDVREAIGEYHLHALHGMVRKAIAKQSEVILERLE